MVTSASRTLFESDRLAPEMVILGFAMVLLASTFDFFMGLAGRTEGDLAIGGVAGLLLLLAAIASAGGIRRGARPVALCFGAFAAVYLFGLARTPSVGGLKHLSQILFVFGVFLFFSNARWNRTTATGLSGVSGLALVGLLPFAWLITSGGESFHFGGKNALGAMVYYLMAIIGISTRSAFIRWLTVPVAVLTGILVNQRTLLVLALALIVGYATLSRLRSRRTASLVFVGTALAMAFFMVTYALPEPLPVYRWLDGILADLTGRSLFSGRQEFWPVIFVGILEAPIVGHGAAATPQVLLGLDVSAHNLYLQVLLQSGIVGFLALFGVLYAIWHQLAGALDRPRTRFAAAAFLTILLHQMVEVSLTQNRLALGLLQWTIIGLALGLTQSAERTDAALPGPADGWRLEIPGRPDSGPPSPHPQTS